MTMVLEVDELGAITIPPDMLGEPAPHARYVISSCGDTLVLEPETKGPTKRTHRELTSDEWDAEWADFSKRVTQAWTSDKSAVEIVSEMRR